MTRCLSISFVRGFHTSMNTAVAVWIEVPPWKSRDRSMGSEQIALFFHLIGAFLFVSGSIGIFIIRYSANSYTKPLEISLLLRTARYLVPLVAIGLVMTIGFGLWLAKMENYWKESWLVGTYALVGYMILVGGFAGGRDKKTRLLAESMLEHEYPNAELLRNLKDPLTIGLNISMMIAIVLVIILMVFKPGH